MKVIASFRCRSGGERRDGNERKKESEAVLFTNGEEHDGKKEVIERNVKIVSVRPGSEDVVAVVSSRTMF